MSRRASYLTQHGAGWKYRRRIPDELRRLLSGTKGQPIQFIVRHIGAMASAEAGKQAREFAANDDRMFDRLRALTPAERVAVIAAKGWDGYIAQCRRTIEGLETGLKFVTAVAALETDENLEEIEPEDAAVILDARRSARRMRAEVEQHKATIAIKPNHRGTMQDLIPLWKANTRSEVTPKHVERMQIYLDRFIAAIGDRAARDVTREHAMLWRDNLAALSMTHSSKQKHIDHVKTLFRAALSKGEVALNPLAGVTVQRTAIDLKKPKKKPEFQAEDYRTVLAGLEKEDKNFAWFVRVMIYHGCRGKEVAHLQVGDVSTERGVPVLRIQPENERLKNAGSERVVPIHPSCMGLVEYAAKRTGPWLFDTKSKKWKNGRADSIQKYGNGVFLRKKCKMPAGLTFHRFRHSWRSLSREVEMPDHIACGIGGWALGKGEHARYGSVAPIKVLRKWIEKIDPSGASPSPD